MGGNGTAHEPDGQSRAGAFPQSHAQIQKRRQAHSSQEPPMPGLGRDMPGKAVTQRPRRDKAERSDGRADGIPIEQDGDGSDAGRGAGPGDRHQLASSKPAQDLRPVSAHIRVER
jgi:hypothetical protein